MIRNTRQRQAIQSLFDKTNNPLSVEDVRAGAEREVNGIGIATVYRNIKSLLEEGVLTTVDLPGEPPRYELAGKGHHHHFQCTRCSRVYDMKACLNGLKKMLLPGFRMTNHDVILYGECAKCRRQSNHHRS